MYYFANAEQLLADFSAMKHRLCYLVAMFFAFALPVVAAGQTGRVQLAKALTEAEPFEARFETLTAENEFVFRSGDTVHTIPYDEFVYWGRYRDDDRGPKILLTDGSLLCNFHLLALNDETIIFDSSLWGEVSLPLAKVRGILFSPPTDPLNRDLLIDRMEQAAGRSDRVLLVNGDEVEGTLLQSEAGEADAGRVPAAFALRPAGSREIVKLPSERIQAIILNPALLDPFNKNDLAENVSQLTLGLNDGSLFHLANATLADETSELPLLAGFRFKAATSKLKQRIVYLQAYGKNITPLSELPAAKYVHTPFLSQSWPFEINRNVLGGKLRSANGEIAISGIGMHSRAGLAYALGRNASRFQAELAIDQKAKQQGSCVFRVYLKREGKLAPAFNSDVIRGGQTPTPLDIDVSGASAMLLIVDYADRADVLDYANWLNARIVTE